jgi:hypothetical protein
MSRSQAEITVARRTTIAAIGSARSPNADVETRSTVA